MQLAVLRGPNYGLMLISGNKSVADSDRWEELFSLNMIKLLLCQGRNHNICTVHRVLREKCVACRTLGKHTGQHLVPVLRLICCETQGSRGHGLARAASMKLVLTLGAFLVEWEKVHGVNFWVKKLGVD